MISTRTTPRVVGTVNVPPGWEGPDRARADVCGEPAGGAGRGAAVGRVPRRAAAGDRPQWADADPGPGASGAARAERRGVDPELLAARGAPAVVAAGNRDGAGAGVGAAVAAGQPGDAGRTARPARRPGVRGAGVRGPAGAVGCRGGRAAHRARPVPDAEPGQRRPGPAVPARHDLVRRGAPPALRAHPARGRGADARPGPARRGVRDGRRQPDRGRAAGRVRGVPGGPGTTRLRAGDARRRAAVRPQAGRGRGARALLRGPLRAGLGVTRLLPSAPRPGPELPAAAEVQPPVATGPVRAALPRDR